MYSFKQLSIFDAKTMMEDRPVTVVDIRDAQSYQQSHIADAIHLDNSSVQDFLQSADLDQALIVYCYHGHSSMSAAQFLIEKGFDEVYSMDGGYEQWRSHFRD